MSADAGWLARDEAVARYTGGVLTPLERSEYEAICAAAGIEPVDDDALYVADIYTELPLDGWRYLTLAEHVRVIADYRRALAIEATIVPVPAWHEYQWGKRERDRERFKDYIAIRAGYGARQHCQRCGNSGFLGQYPFSTNPQSGLCDDCA